MTLRFPRSVVSLCLTVGLAACAISPVTGAGKAPALTTVQPTMAIGVGQEKDLLPFVRIAGTGAVPLIPLTWTISNPALLFVDPATGRAKGLSSGTVVVEVKAPGNDAGAAQLVIEVVGQGAAVVKDIQVLPSSHHMAVDEAVTLRAQVFLPDGQINGNVAWASSDDTIATVNPTNGSVSALKPGRVTIVAAYMPSPAFKAVADIFIYATRAEIPPSPVPASQPTPSAVPDLTRPGLPSPPVRSSGSSGAPLTLPAPTPGATNPTTLTSSVGPSPSPTPTSAPSPSPVPSPTAPATPSPSQALGTVYVSTLAGGDEAGFADGTGSAAKFWTPTGVAADTDGNLYVTDGINNRLRKVNPSGIVSTLAGSGRAGAADGTGAQASFNAPLGVAVDGSGNVYVADGNNRCIRKVTPSGVVSTLAGSGTEGLADGTGTDAQFKALWSLAVDAGGNLYATDWNCIRKITPGGVVTTLAGSEAAGFADGPASMARFAGPTGVAVDRRGNVYVADTGNYRIRKITPSGEVSTLAGGSVDGVTDGTGRQARFTAPMGLGVDAEGNLYVGDTGRPRVRKIVPTGVVTTYAGSGENGFADGTGAEARFSFPRSIAVDDAGHVYVVEPHRIRVVRPAAGG